MYEAAREHNADCVMADYIAFWDDGRQEHVRSVEFPDAGRPDIMKYSAKYGTVNICTKLVARDLFDIIRFPAGFYEDLATTPILLSWAKNVSYSCEGLYFYRQRVGSITSIKSGDKRLLDCYAAWDRIREHANPLFEKEIQFAVYWSLNFSAPIFSMTSQSSPRITMTGTGTISAETLILPTRSVKRHFWILSIWTRSRKSSITAGSATGRKASSFKNAWIPGRSTPRILRSWSGMNPIATFTQTGMWKKRTKRSSMPLFPIIFG